jgi:hypothetical protein
VQSCTANLQVDQLVAQCMKTFRVCADAIVRVHAQAAAACSTYGPNTVGCADAVAQVSAQEQAIIELLSQAIAKAANLCPRCDPSFATAAATNTARLVAQLIARASAFAKASVCVGPNQTASAEAYSACASQVWAHGLAYAFAQATISGRCNNIQADATTKVQNLINADIYCQCRGWLRVCEQGQCTYQRKAGTGVPALNYCQNSWPQTYAVFKAECTATIQEL